MPSFNPHDKYPEILKVFKGKTTLDQLKNRIMNYLGVITPSVIENHMRTMAQLGYIEPSKTENGVFIIKVKP